MPKRKITDPLQDDEAIDSTSELSSESSDDSLDEEIDAEILPPPPLARSSAGDPIAPAEEIKEPEAISKLRSLYKVKRKKLHSLEAIVPIFVIEDLKEHYQNRNLDKAFFAFNLWAKQLPDDQAGIFVKASVNRLINQYNIQDLMSLVWLGIMELSQTYHDLRESELTPHRALFKHLYEIERRFNLNDRFEQFPCGLGDDVDTESMPMNKTAAIRHLILTLNDQRLAARHPIMQKWSGLLEDQLNERAEAYNEIIKVKNDLHEKIQAHAEAKGAPTPPKKPRLPMPPRPRVGPLIIPPLIAPARAMLAPPVQLVNVAGLQVSAQDVMEQQEALHQIQQASRIVEVDGIKLTEHELLAQQRLLQEAQQRAPRTGPQGTQPIPPVQAQQGQQPIPPLQLQPGQQFYIPSFDLGAFLSRFAPPCPGCPNCAPAVAAPSATGAAPRP